MTTLILGTNLRGLADAARISLAEGETVHGYDSEATELPATLVGKVTQLPREWSPSYLEGIDRVVASPWFSPLRPPLSDVLASGIDVITEAGFGLEHMNVPFVAITGTNGKTTVTEMATAMLAASGVNVCAAGNVGEPVSGIVNVDADMLVLELSSYQLRFLGSRAPVAAALLNIAPDHLDWHGSFAEYAAAKSMIFQHMAPTSILAYNADDAAVVSAVAEAPCRLVSCSGMFVPDGGNGFDGDCLVVNGSPLEVEASDRSHA